MGALEPEDPNNFDNLGIASSLRSRDGYIGEKSNDFDERELASGPREAGIDEDPNNFDDFDIASRPRS